MKHHVLQWEIVHLSAPCVPAQCCLAQQYKDAGTQILRFLLFRLLIFISVSGRPYPINYPVLTLVFIGGHALWLLGCLHRSNESF